MSSAVCVRVSGVTHTWSLGTASRHTYPCKAGIRAIGAASGAAAAGGEAVVLGGLRAGFGCDAYVVIRDGFAPHIPLQASIGWWGCVTAAGTGESDRGAPVWPGKVLVNDQRRLSRSRSGWLEGDL